MSPALDIAGGGLGGLPSVTFTVFTGRLGDVAIGGLPGMPETCRSYVFVAMPVTVTVATWRDVTHACRRRRPPIPPTNPAFDGGFDDGVDDGATNCVVVVVVVVAGGGGGDGFAGGAGTFV